MNKKSLFQAQWVRNNKPTYMKYVSIRTKWFRIHGGRKATVRIDYTGSFAKDYKYVAVDGSTILVSDLIAEAEAEPTRVAETFYITEIGSYDEGRAIDQSTVVYMAECLKHYFKTCLYGKECLQYLLGKGTMKQIWPNLAESSSWAHVRRATVYLRRLQHKIGGSRLEWLLALDILNENSS